MEAETVRKVSAVRSEIETIDTVGSESHKNREDHVRSSSKNQEKDFALLDSVYSAAEVGDINEFTQHKDVIGQILTPNGNTILHIYISARPRRKDEEMNTKDFMRGIFEMCPDLIWQVNKKGETLLHMAARHGHADVAKFLLDKYKKSGQNHDQERGIKATRQMLQMASNEAKDTALHEAVRYGHLDVVNILIKEDRSLPYEANTAGGTPLYLAAERGYRKVLEAILKICDSPADGGPYDRTALHMAAFHNDKEMTTLLLAEEGTCTSKQDKQGWTPLHFAADLGHIEILKKLLAKDKCAAYTADKEGKTALHVAAAGGKVEIMKELLSTCPGCCELVDNKGRNVLHFALTNSDSTVNIRLLLRNPSIRNLATEKDYEKGNTPFLQAASVGRIGCFLEEPILTPVDMLAFNHDDHNAADLLSANASKSRRDIDILNLVLWFLEKKEKIRRGMRPTGVSENDNGKSKSQGGKVKIMRSESEDVNNITEDRVNKIMENSLLAATLIATVSFAAGITIPGGFISDEEPDKGTATLTGHAAFRAFVVFNTISLLLSSLAVLLHLFGSKSSSILRMYFTCYAMMTMMAAFISGTWAVLRRPDRGLAINTTTVVMVVALLYLISFSSRRVVIFLVKNTARNKNMFFALLSLLPSLLTTSIIDILDDDR